MPEIMVKIEPEVFRYLPCQGVSFFDGHMPFTAHRLLAIQGQQPHCLAILRHPIDRVLSHLSQNARRVGLEPGEIDRLYHHPQWQGVFGRNYQVRLFSMTEKETFAGSEVSPEWREFMDLLVLAVCSITHEQRLDAVKQLGLKADKWAAGKQDFVFIEEQMQQQLGREIPHTTAVCINNSRFESAVHALEQCAVIGVTDQLNRMVEDMGWRFGWPDYGIQTLNQGRGQVRSFSALRKQIARDNEADIELYEYARKLVRRQQQARLRRYSLPW